MNNLKTNSNRTGKNFLKKSKIRDIYGKTMQKNSAEDEFYGILADVILLLTGVNSSAALLNRFLRRMLI